MDKIQTTDCYVPVEKVSDYIVKNLRQVDCPYWTKNAGCTKHGCDCLRSDRIVPYNEIPVEKKEGVIVQTVSEAREMIRKAMVAQYDTIETDCEREEYIKSLLP